MFRLKLISSKGNQKIKDLHKLFCSSKMRSQSGLFVIEGTRLCFDAYRSGAEFESVFITENYLEKFKDDVENIINSAKEAYIVTEEIMKHIGDTVNPQGIVCVCKNNCLCKQIPNSSYGSNTFDIHRYLCKTC